MKILFLSSHDPADVAHGIGVIVANTLRCLIHLGHVVSIVVIADTKPGGFNWAQGDSGVMESITLNRVKRNVNPRADALRALTYFSHPEEDLFLEIVRKQTAENQLAIWFGHSWDPLSSRIASACRCPLLLHVSDSISLGRQQSSNRLTGRIRSTLAMFRESSVLRQLEPHRVGAVYVAEADRQRALRLAARDAKSIFCLPLAVDTQVFCPRDRNHRRESPPTLLFTGTMNFAPNVDAVNYLVREILPLIPEHLEVRIVGRNPGSSVLALSGIDARVNVVGEVHDISQEYAQADIFVAPMLPSSGMKNKILEAMACGLPVVASPDALGGFPEITGGVRVGHGASQMAGLIRGLLNDAPVREELGGKNREYVVRGHSWLDRTAKLIALLQQ